MVDSKIWKLVKSHVRKYLKKAFPNIADDHLELVIQSLESFWLNFNANWFIKLEGLGLFYKPDQKEEKIWRKCWPKNPTEDIMMINLTGSTFSGHPTLTTLGNTIRSLCYMWFSLENTGFYEPWKNERCLAVASGDDSVV